MGPTTHFVSYYTLFQALLLSPAVTSIGIHKTNAATLNSLPKLIYTPFDAIGYQSHKEITHTTFTSGDIIRLRVGLFRKSQCHSITIWWLYRNTPKHNGKFRRATQIFKIQLLHPRCLRVKKMKRTVQNSRCTIEMLQQSLHAYTVRYNRAIYSFWWLNVARDHEQIESASLWCKSYNCLDLDVVDVLDYSLRNCSWYRTWWRPMQANEVPWNRRTSLLSFISSSFIYASVCELFSCSHSCLALFRLYS